MLFSSFFLRRTKMDEWYTARGKGFRFNAPTVLLGLAWLALSFWPLGFTIVKLSSLC